MSYQPEKKSKARNPARTPAQNPIARLHSPAVMLILVFLLVVYLVYVLAENFGIEGEGGWMGEVIGATTFVAGIIVAAVLVAVIYFGLRRVLRPRQKDSPWMEDETDDIETPDKK